jgi:hypothetical protein
MLVVVRIESPKLASPECHDWGSSNFTRQSLGTPYRRETCHYCSSRELLNQRLQLGANWTIPFNIDAVARCATRLILHFAFLEVLSQRAGTQCDDRNANYHPFDRCDLRDAISFHFVAPD